MTFDEAWAESVIRELWWVSCKILAHDDVFSKKKTRIIITPTGENLWKAEIYPATKDDGLCDPEVPWLRVYSDGRYEVATWEDILEGHIEKDKFWLAEGIVEVLSKLGVPTRTIREQR